MPQAPQGEAQGEAAAEGSDLATFFRCGATKLLVPSLIDIASCWYMVYMVYIVYIC